MLYTLLEESKCYIILFILWQRYSRAPFMIALSLCVCMLLLLHVIVAIMRIRQDLDLECDTQSLSNWLIWGKIVFLKREGHC